MENEPIVIKQAVKNVPLVLAPCQACVMDAGAAPSRHVPHPGDPFKGLLACPRCGFENTLTYRQFEGLVPIVCQNDKKDCRLYFFLKEDAFEAGLVLRVVLCAPS